MADEHLIKLTSTVIFPSFFENLSELEIKLRNIYSHLFSSPKKHSKYFLS
jgi:hypothetical protein